MKFWSEKEVSLLIERYPHCTTAMLAKELQRTPRQVYFKASLLKLKKSEAFNDSQLSGQLTGKQGASTRFVKGQIPWNKGKKGLCLGGQETHFKKGNRPHNSLPVGSIVPRDDGYLQVKTEEPNKWQLVHRLVWECENGPVPEGMIIKFRDGNRANFSIDNLYLSDRRRNMADNTFTRYPAELRQTMKALKSLTKIIEENGKEQNRRSPQPSL